MTQAVCQYRGSKWKERKGSYLQGRNRNADFEMDVWTGWGGVERGGRDELGGWDWHACTPTGETKGQWEPALSHRELGPVPCADLEGWGRGEGGGSLRERGHIYSYS